MKINKSPTPDQNRAHMTALAKLYGAPAHKFTPMKTYKQPSLPLSKLPDTISLWGDHKYRGECELEWREQAEFVKMVRMAYPHSFGILLVHVKNEGLRTEQEARNAKIMGMKEGTCDIIIPAKVPFLCEIKRRDKTKSTITQSQIDYLETGKKNGCFVCVALGAGAAWEAFEYWLIENG